MKLILHWRATVNYLESDILKVLYREFVQESIKNLRNVIAN